MTWPLLLALAVGPALSLAHVVWSVDRRREPVRNVLRYLLVGVLTVVPAFIAEKALQGTYRALLGEKFEPGLVLLLVGLVVGVALVEESVKLFGLLWLGRKDREIDEPFDWIVYAVTVSLGFAMVENVSYVLAGGVAVGLARALTSVPSHALNGTIMGHRLALASCLRGGAARRQRVLALIEPTLWHGLYDFFAMAAGKEARHGDVHVAVRLGVAFVVLIVCQWIVCVRRIRVMRELATPVPPLLYPIEAMRRVVRVPRRG
jgi:RsiW-degrading membrane proteinase PrsW (M82 family)